MHLDDQTQSIIHLFICAWVCGCIRTHQHLRQISVIWWPELYHQNKLVAFLSLFCLFPSNAKFLWGTWAISSLTADSLLPFFLLILTWSVPADKRSPQSLSELVQLLLRWGVGGCYGVIATKNQTHCSIFLPLAPSFCLLKFWCWMVTHCEIASCLGGLCGARSGSYIWSSLDSEF